MRCKCALEDEKHRAAEHKQQLQKVCRLAMKPSLLLHCWSWCCAPVHCTLIVCTECMELKRSYSCNVLRPGHSQAAGS
jgi:hypothetical protein